VIDGYDFVVRINLASANFERVDLGSRTDLRFIGATLNSSHDKEFSENIVNEIILTTSKNKMYMQYREEKIFFYHSEMPKQAFKWYACLTGKKSFLKCRKPPRSGLVFILSILAMSRPKKVTTFGFSIDPNCSNMKLLSEKGLVVEYDKKLLQRNHCLPEYEVEILNRLAQNLLIYIGDDA
jgi:hypothetical protein